MGCNTVLGVEHAKHALPLMGYNPGVGTRGMLPTTENETSLGCVVSVYGVVSRRETTPNGLQPFCRVVVYGVEHAKHALPLMGDNPGLNQGCHN